MLLFRDNYLADFQRDPAAINKTAMLINAFDVFPDAILPALSKKNQAKSPANTAFLTSSGALS